MTQRLLTPSEVREAGFAALVDVLGPADAVRFVRQFSTGRGDYTAGRERLLGDPTVDSLIAEAERSRRNGARPACPPPYARLHAALKRLAAAGKTTTYAKVAALLGLDRRDRAITRILGDISAYEHAHGRPMLSAVVVHKTGGGRQSLPGAGFFILARELGLQAAGQDDQTFFAMELKRVHHHWAR